MRYLFVMLCIVLLCASVGNANLIYEFIDLSSEILAEIEFSKLPASEGEILSFHFTEAGNDIFELGDNDIGGFLFTLGEKIEKDGAGLKGNANFFGVQRSEIATFLVGIGDLALNFNDIGGDSIKLSPDPIEIPRISTGDWTEQPVIPEPSTLVLFALGFCGILGLSYRHQRRKSTAICQTR